MLEKGSQYYQTHSRCPKHMPEHEHCSCRHPWGLHVYRGQPVVHCALSASANDTVLVWFADQEMIGIGLFVSYRKKQVLVGSTWTDGVLLQGAGIRDVQAVGLLLCPHGQRPAHGLRRCPHELPHALLSLLSSFSWLLQALSLWLAGPRLAASCVSCCSHASQALWSLIDAGLCQDWHVVVCAMCSADHLHHADLLHGAPALHRSRLLQQLLHCHPSGPGERPVPAHTLCMGVSCNRQH